MMQKRDLNYLTGILLIFALLFMLITGLIQIRFELHRFFYHIYGAYLLIVLAILHVWANWKKILRFINRKETILSIALILSLIFTLVSGFVQVKLNFPRSRFVYHIYSAYVTLTLALVHICINLKKLVIYLKGRSPRFLLNADRPTWKMLAKRAALLAAALFVIAAVALAPKTTLPKKDTGMRMRSKVSKRINLNMAVEYHRKTKHTYAELMARTGGLDWSRQPSVFKEYPRAELIRLSTDLDFDSVSVEEAIEGSTLVENFSREPISESELSRLLYYTNGITKELKYTGLTHYLRAAPSAGALYPTVIYLIINNVEGFRQGLYHYSVKDHAVHLLKEGDFSEQLAASVRSPSLVKDSGAVFIMSAIFYRSKWKYRERGYRYALLDTGHVGGNLTLTATALGLGSYPIATFIDDRINQMLGIDGIKEAVVYMFAVGKKASSDENSVVVKGLQPTADRSSVKRLPEGSAISEILHESGKLYSLTEADIGVYKGREVSYKSYPKAEKIYLPKEFSKQGLSLDDAIRKRRSARDYSGENISKFELSRLLYYSYGLIKDNPIYRSVRSIEGVYPIEIYIVVNNVEDIKAGIYHYNVLEHALELLKEGDYAFQIAKACLGQRLVGRANVAIIKTAIFGRLKDYGDRGYRYIHLDAGAIGENIYLEAVSMGLGVCGIGAFFDDQVNDILGIDGVDETSIYVTSVGRLR